MKNEYESGLFPDFGGECVDDPGQFDELASLNNRPDFLFKFPYY